MVLIQINGKMVKAHEGEMVLSVLRREGIEVPALCDHQALEPGGSCRLCMVEITKADWDGWTKNVTSCLYPVEEGLIVSTHSEGVLEIRRNILDMLLARCPNSDVIQKLAEEHGVMKTSFDTLPDSDNCIMCYACTRVCEVLGKSAISAVMRGHKKVIASPFGDAPPDCIGCLSCAHICPTNVILWKDENGKRTIWNKSFDLITCKKCGKETISREFADYLLEQRDIPADYFETCDDCKRMELAFKMGGLVDGAEEVAI
ncbi:MAG: (2Fe-2S)-binding protein [candidate division Zixibacteria bacterium]|nr:(2Fe-2S)-binding protein [candidate division Zixibacteria bacterium]